MRGIAQNQFVCGDILLCVLLICLLALPIASQSTNQPSEATLYGEWYEARKQNDFFKVIDLSIFYAIHFPEGQYVKFMKACIGPLRDEIQRPENNEGNGKKRIDFLSVKRRDYLKPLMESSLDVNIPLGDGKTLLMVAAVNGDVTAVKVLLEKGAAINTVEKVHGWTSLIYAVWNSDISTIQMLVDNGADLEIKDAEGLTIFDHARLTANPKVQELLENIRQKK